MNALKFFYHFLMARFGDIIYRSPSRRLFVLGVTGTKGKSTVVALISHILETAGCKTAYISSVNVKIGDDLRKNLTGNTMPGRFFLQRFLKKAADAGCRCALIEVTSQGVLQHRHRFIEWDGALITNLEPEHIEAHGSFENYRQAKVDFFKLAALSSKPKRTFFLNKDMKSLDYFEKAVSGRGELVFFSRDDFLIQELSKSYDLNSKKDQHLMNYWLLTEFSLENAAAAAAVGRAMGIKWENIRRALESFKGVAGRMEIVQEKPFRIVIDYAHTPDSLEKVYQTLRDKSSKLKAKLICVLGAAGGGRDKWKRPVMGKIAAQYCGEVILTNEDPYDENPNQILSEIKSGIFNFPAFAKASAGKQLPISNYYEILDRREAIQKAIALAKKGDTVVITGKGSEPWIHVKRGKKIPWNERKIVEEVLRF